MKSILQQLRTLNDVDVRIQTLRKDLDRLPKELATQGEEPRLLRDQLERRKAEIKRLKGEAEAVEQDLKSGMEALKRYANQMNLLRTSKEFEAVKRQMDAQRVWNSQNEDKALEFLKQADDKQKDVDEQSQRLAELEAALEARRLQVEKDVAELKAQAGRLQAERGELSKALPEKELAIYDRIVVNRGQALARIERGHCSACHMKLPPQIHNLVLLGKELVTCSSCGRILTAK